MKHFRNCQFLFIVILLTGSNLLNGLESSSIALDPNIGGHSGLLSLNRGSSMETSVEVSVVKHIKRSARVKRALGQTMDMVTLNMTELSEPSDGSADIGDTFHFKIVIDLPKITIAQTVRMEIFGFDPLTGVGGFMICSARQESVGSNVQFASGPTYENIKKLNYDSVVEKAVLTWDSVTTTAEDSGDLNKIVILFEAMLVPLPEVASGNKYYISAGIEYSEEAYVWVGQAEVQASLSGTLFDASVAVAGDLADTLKKGEAFLIDIEAYITSPMADIVLTANQPLGYGDVFHFGEITYTLGTSFSCSEPTLWEGTPTLSTSGASNSKYTLRYPGLLNFDGSRAVADVANKITFHVPIQVLNSEQIYDGMIRDVAFGLEIGENKLWTAIHTFTISGVADAGTPSAPSSADATLANEGDILAGDGVVYSVAVTVTAGAWINLDVIFEGGTDFPAGNVRIATTGTVAYVTPVWLAQRQDGAKILVDFGAVFNPAATDTVLILEVAVNTIPTIAPGSYTPTLLSVGGTAVTLPQFTVVANPGTANITVAIEEYSVNELLSNNLYLFGQVAMDLIVTVPSGTGRIDLGIEAVPDFDVTAFAPRVCKIKVYDVGRNLPCIDSIEETGEVIYNKTSDTREMNDWATLELGPTCPINRDGRQPEDNQFRANIIFELTPSPSIVTDTSLSISAGIRVDEDSVWVTTGDFTVKNSVFTDSVKSVSNVVVPFFTDYPYVSKLEDAVMSVGDSFFIKYILKPQPLSVGKYVITLSPGINFRVCKLVVTHIGGNFPCTQMPDDTPSGAENSVWGFSGTDYAENTDVVLSFSHLTNWGRESLVTDLTPDDDSIQLVAFFQYQTVSTNSTRSVGWKVDYGTSLLSGSTSVNVYPAGGSIKLDLEGREAPTFLGWEALIGTKATVNKGMAKLLRFNFKIPKGYYNSFRITFENKAFDDAAKQIDFCSAAIVSAGNNLPCIHAWGEDVERSLKNDSASMKVNTNDETVYKGYTLVINNMCFLDYSPLDEESKLSIDMAFRVKDSFPTGSDLTLVVTTVDQANADAAVEITMNVADYDASVVTPTPLTPEDVQVKIPPENLYGVNITVGEKLWLPFIVQIPGQAISPAQVSFLMPSFDKRPILHATDVKFDECEGKNVLCMEPHIDLRRNFPAVFGQTGNVSTFMSMDSVTVDLGYVINAGYTTQWGGEIPEDNEFALQVEVQLSDHPLTVHGSQFEVYFAITFGDTIVVASQKVNVTRAALTATDRILLERGNIVVEVNQTEAEDTIYDAGSIVSFTSTIYHANDSKAEGSPGKIRVITPTYVRYIVGQNTFSANYSVASVSTDKVILGSSTELSVTDFEFVGGILFPDIISLNFTLTVDPNKERPVGSGDAQTAIAMHPVCLQSIFNSWPASPTTYVGCGSMTAAPFISSAPECYDLIPISNPCQVTASSQLDSNSSPFNALTTTGVWSPALRTGKGWNEYLVFDFLVVARLNRVKITSPDAGVIAQKTFRQVLKAKIEVSNSPPYFNFVTEKDLPVDKTIALAKAVEARYVKITVTPDMNNPDASAIGVFGIKFFGCLTDDLPADFTCASYTPPMKTILADDPKAYRHFAVDTTATPIVKRIVYFCDLNPYRTGMFCYCSDRLSGGTNTWSELPRYIGHIIGFSASTGRMYFRDTKGVAVMSSYNCKDVELSSEASLPDDIEPAVSVPGKASKDVTPVIWGNDKLIKGNFDGIWDDATLLVKWKTCCETV